MNMIIRFAISLFLLVFGIAFAQIKSTRPAPAPETNPPPVIIRTNLFPAASNSAPVLAMRPRTHSAPPAPGLYLTKPYTCMMLVPGPYPDDCVLPGTTNKTTIPTIKPDLKFIPLAAPGK